MGKRSLLFERYTQVFDDKHGFVNNLSVLDLLFNEGKFTLDYTKPKIERKIKVTTIILMTAAS
jgi:hypothetical protein